ncbi:hypothetical protein FQN54_002983 [Arachnomyces sp. PD_36]|nr:hypothetical protein FQN54_002983 [Arachnomyces sp. PD_36]
MSDNAVPPASNASHTSSTTNATAGPTSNAHSPVQPASDADRSRIADRIAIARAEGHGPDTRLDEDEGEEDFVAVDHEDAETDFSYYFRRQPQESHSKLDELHPFVQLLSLSNVDDCVTVEAAFPEPERCSKEKLVYRLTKCPELTLGVFSLPPANADHPKPRPTLVAHVIATRSPAGLVNEASMSYPPDWQTKSSTLPKTADSEPLGHQDQGSSIHLHSLAVLPEHQGKGLGTMIMKSYIQRIKDALIAERISLLARDKLVPFYEGLGFEHKGKSNVTAAGGGWNDMVGSRLFEL